MEEADEDEMWDPPLPTGAVLRAAHSMKFKGIGLSDALLCSSRGTRDWRTLLVRRFS